MTRVQRAVRIGIWIFFPLMLIGSLDVAVTQFAGFAQNRDLVHVPSPDGKYVATINVGMGDCGFVASEKSKAVFVERRSFGVKTGLDTPFCIGDADAHVGVNWAGARTLTITCESCDAEKYGMSKTNWGELRYRFDLQR